MKRRDFLKIATGSAGGAAAIGVAGARSSSTSAAVQEGEGNNTTAGNGTAGNATTDGSGSGESDGLPGAGTTKTVQVGPNGNNIFDPETVYIQPGATVEWVWRSSGHNVHATDVPEEADWSVQTEITGPEFSYSYTFDGPTGEYNYVCDPHEALGMVGKVVVNESGQPPGGEGGEAELDPHHMGVPLQAHFVGIATILMMIVSLVYAFFVLKYGESQNASAPNKE
ncbi:MULTISPECIES: plastocyanin/azurin family copper-binding protein [Halobacterium]|uniref:plastocyanin/azurin family copper-binding protein n=1 Tax=Halobacterium TaxID=2239 RepID=UPI00073E1327|nr:MULTISPECIES: plastocyanin/azurin family copper-binding protein [Halobacterium]MCG1002500.1 plastocyanin/azurin family copper-binding protein [Halobacterium noricense]